MTDTTAEPQTREDTLERLAELLVEDAVDDRVHRTVDVSEPGEDGEDYGRNARLAESSDNVGREEGSPTDEKCAHDDAKRDGGLVLGHARLHIGGGPYVAVSDLREEFLVASDPLHVDLGVVVELDVDQNHDDAWQVETHDRRQDSVEGVQIQRADEEFVVRDLIL